MNSSYIYDDSGCNKFDYIYKDKFIFRKTLPNLIEIKIANLLKENTNPNIVKFYDIRDEHIDMELLETYYTNSKITPFIFTNKKLIKEQMENVKFFLQNLGIAYIDWKIDNIGFTDGTFTLFDFDMSGIFDLETKEWIIEPELGFNYKLTKRQRIKNPIDIDNKCFDNAFL
jgi:hypothetical protein